MNNTHLQNNFSKQFWLDLLHNYVCDQDTSSIDQQISLWTQDITDPLNPPPPRVILRNLLHFWNSWIQQFKATHPILFEYLRKRNIFVPGTSFLTNINKKGKSINHQQLLFYCNYFQFESFFIKLNQLIYATIDILEDKKEQLIWIKHFFKRNPHFRKLSLNLIRRIDPNSFIFCNRIHPATE